MEHFLIRAQGAARQLVCDSKLHQSLRKKTELFRAPSRSVLEEKKLHTKGFLLNGTSSLSNTHKTTRFLREQKANTDVSFIANAVKLYFLRFYPCPYRCAHVIAD